MPVLVTYKFEKDLIKNNRKGQDIVFPIISQWALTVAMETGVLIQPALKTLGSLYGTAVDNTCDF